MSTIIPAEFSDVATLCTAKEVVIGSQVVLGVDARALHEGLGVKRDFATWTKARINSLGLEEGVDYERISRSPVLGSGNRGASTDYTLTLDAAKHIAMVEKNEMGRLIRSYFIWVEKQQITAPSALTAREVGGIAKSVVNKAVAPVMEEIASLRSHLEHVVGSYDPTGIFVTGYRPMSAVVNEHKIPSCGRRGLVVKCSNRCARFLQRNGMGGMIRCTREQGTRLFHQEGLDKWLLAEGKEILLNARDIAIGQNTIPFPRAVHKEEKR
ncbi:hypothetical protein GS501_00030 [Saccharibacter sp. 17.LH.SD]|uniref:antA/AntB antirepressor family protein n=1 Tax=Saccharibacter sp. 17.LH.SD TaxID=2689393 RepID=UPI00136C65C6|nr:antA/AntB antirepressor family protein [Saccharibacter sp. 17.LH.SD]MXV43468.1 hypothetical protein [Saccharibacter sp. 17.LH.SD]